MQKSRDELFELIGQLPAGPGVAVSDSLFVAANQAALAQLIEPCVIGEQ